MRTYSAVSFLCLALVFSAACGGEDSEETPRSVKPTKGEHFFVVGNGVACFVAPCPSFTAINKAGDVIDLSKVVLPESANPILAKGLNVGGLEVEGTIKEGSFEVGGPGSVLKVKKILAGAKTFTAFDNHIKCITAPCPNITTVTQTGTKKKVSAIDFSPINVDGTELEKFHTDVLTGNMVVHGFIVGTGSFAELLVTKIAAVTEVFTLKHTPIVCVVAPCPNIRATNDAGQNTLVDLNLSGLQVTASKKNELLNLLFKQGSEIKVKGYIDQPTFGKVLFATRLDE